MSARALRLRTWPTNLGVGVLVLISAVVQTAHVATLGNGQLETVVGQCLAAVFPGTLWLAASTVERIRFSAAVSRMAAIQPRRARPVVRAIKSSGRPATPRSRVNSRPTVGTRIDPALRSQAIALVDAGQSINAAARDLGVGRTTLQGWLHDRSAVV